MAPLDLSIVIPVYEEQKNLDRILAELSANSPGDNWEVIIVDDGSPTALELTKNTRDNWKIYRNEKQRGAASSRNIGIKQACGKHIVLLSVFLKIPKNYIARISKFIDGRDFDVAQHLVVKAPHIDADHFQEFLADQSGRLAHVNTNLPVKNTLFTAAVFKKETFSAVGGFDENMNHYGGHELDLAYRLDQKGFSRRIVIEGLPLERVKLETHVSIRSRLQEYGRIGLPALLKKHPELKKSILLYPGSWFWLKLLGIPKRMEANLKRKIEQDLELTKTQYRKYLHLLVRNAWDAR